VCYKTCYMQSRYSLPCPKCHAAAWNLCRSTSGHSLHSYVHAARTLDKGPKVSAIPTFVNWWRSMQPYEGKHPKDRTGLEVPSQAELAGVEV